MIEKYCKLPKIANITSPYMVWKLRNIFPRFERGEEFIINHIDFQGGYLYIYFKPRKCFHTSFQIFFFTLEDLNRIKSYHVIFKDLLISSVKWQEKQSRSSGRPSRDVMNFTRHFVSTVSRRVVFYSPMVCTVSVEVSSSESNNSNFPVVNIGLRSLFFLVPNYS